MGLLRVLTRDGMNLKVLSQVCRVCAVHRSCVGVENSRSYYTYSPEPFHPLPHRMPLWGTAEEAISVIKSDQKVYVHGTSATPIPLLEAMAEHGKKAGLKNVQVIHIHAEGPGSYTKPEYDGIFRNNSLFIGANCRQAVNEGRGDFTPIFLSEVPLLFRRNIVNLDIALVSLSPPDEHGYCTLGSSIVATRAAVQNAKYIIGQVNSNLPRTFGDGMIHMSHIDAMVEHDYPIPEHKKHAISPEEDKIGALIAENLVEDGSTLQTGIGAIPDAVLSRLTDHKDLGIHSEMFSDGVVDLAEKGNITNARKKIQTGKIVSSFVIGSRRVFDFLDNNPFVVMCDVGFVNNLSVIRKNPKVTAINSCIEMDLTGQIVSDSIGARMYSGVGGQVDFIRGAALGDDGEGKPIIAMRSTTNKGESKIQPFLKSGAGVVTTRAHVHYVVTEYGIAYLFGKTLRQRAYELIKVAHPDHRESLERAGYERLKCMPSPN